MNTTKGRGDPPAAACTSPPADCRATPPLVPRRLPRNADADALYLADCRATLPPCTCLTAGSTFPPTPKMGEEGPDLAADVSPRHGSAMEGPDLVGDDRPLHEPTEVRGYLIPAAVS
uniref:Uncharacterized protein n=1 Tax=Arundo donax TaxID=35708 RepID=A0A0A9AKR3_ARUDO